MAKKPRAASVLGPLEAEVMEIMWAQGAPLSVREVMVRLNKSRRDDLAYTTVMTVLSRLAEKEILERRRDGRGFVYEAAVSDPAEIAVRGVMRDFGDSALAHFVEEARADPDTLRRLRGLLADES